MPKVKTVASTTRTKAHASEARTAFTHRDNDDAFDLVDVINLVARAKDLAALLSTAASAYLPPIEDIQEGCIVFEERLDKIKTMLEHLQAAKVNGVQRATEHSPST